MNVSHGLVVISGANLYDTLTDLRLSDLKRNQKMMSSSCRFHMLCAKNGYAFWHNECINDDTSETK